MNFSTRNPHAPPQNKTKQLIIIEFYIFRFLLTQTDPKKRNSLRHEVFTEITTISQTSIKFIGVDKRKFDHDVCKYQPYLIKCLSLYIDFGWFYLVAKKIIIANCFVLFWEIF